MNNSKGLALWVPAESKSRFFSSKDGMKTLKRQLDRLPFTDLFLQVFRQGRTFFDSIFFESEAESTVLSELLDYLQVKNIKAHAWINVCNIGVNPSKKLLDKLAEQKALLANNYGQFSNANLTNFEIDTPGVWLEPSSPELAEYIRILLRELSVFDFSGLHLDFIRYPYAIPIRPASWINYGFDYGYSKEAINRFLAGRPKNEFFYEDQAGGFSLLSENKALEFDTWRREQITKILDLCKTEIKDWRLSVAALAWSDRAYLNAYQDWRSWLSANFIDDLALMTYTADTNLLRQQASQAAAFLNPNQKLFVGIGLYKLKSAQQVLDQLDAIYELGHIPNIFCAEALAEFSDDLKFKQETVNKI